MPSCHCRSWRTTSLHQGKRSTPSGTSNSYHIHLLCVCGWLSNDEPPLKNHFLSRAGGVFLFFFCGLNLLLVSEIPAVLLRQMIRLSSEIRVSYLAPEVLFIYHFQLFRIWENDFRVWVVCGHKYQRHHQMQILGLNLQVMQRTWHQVYLNVQT